MSVEDGLRLLHDRNSNVVQEAQAALSVSLTAGEGWPQVLNFYLQSRSDRALDLLASVRDPNDKVVVELLDDSLRCYPCEVLCVLNHIVLRQPSWLAKLTQSSLFNHVLRWVKEWLFHPRRTAAVYMHVVNGVLFLCNLMPHMILLTQSQLTEMLTIMARSAFLLQADSSTPSSPSHASQAHLLGSLVQPVYVAHLRLCVTLYFQRLYGIFPCNTMHYMKQHMTQLKNVTRSLLLTVRFHPSLIWHSREWELTRERWSQREPHDLQFECTNIAVHSQPADPPTTACMCGGGNVESLTSRLSVLLDSVHASPTKSAQHSPLKPLISLHPSSNGSQSLCVSRSELIRPAPIRMPPDPTELPMLMADGDKKNIFWSPSMTVSLETPPQSRRETPVHSILGRRDSMRSHASGHSNQDRRSVSSTDPPMYRQRRSFGQAMAKIFKSNTNAETIRPPESEEDRADAMCKAIIEATGGGSVPSSPLQTLAETSHLDLSLSNEFHHTSPYSHARQASQVSQAEEAVEENGRDKMSLAQLETVSERLRCEPAANGTEDSEVQRFVFNPLQVAETVTTNATNSRNSNVRSRHTSGTVRSGRSTSIDDITVVRKDSTPSKKPSKPGVVFDLTEDNTSPLDKYVMEYQRGQFNRIRVQSECPNQGLSVLSGDSRRESVPHTPVRKRSNSCPRNLFASSPIEPQLVENGDDVTVSMDARAGVANLIMPSTNYIKQLFPYSNILNSIVNANNSPGLISSLEPSVDEAYSSDKVNGYSPPTNARHSPTLEIMDDYLEASRRVYEFSMSSSGSGSLNKTSKVTADNVIQGLKAQLAMAQQQIIHERYNTKLHSQRNRALYGRLKSNIRNVEEAANMAEKTMLWERTKEEMLKAIYLLYHIKKKLESDVKDREYKLNSLIREHANEVQTLVHKYQVEERKRLDLEMLNDKLRAELATVQKTLFELHANSHNESDDDHQVDKLRHRMSELEQELLCAGELQRVLVASGEHRLNALCQTQAEHTALLTQLEAVRRECADLRRQLRKEKGKGETWSQKSMEMEDQLNRNWQQMHDFESQMEEMRSVHAAHVQAVNVKQQTLLNVCQRLEVYIGELNAHMEANETGHQPRHSAAIDVSVPNRPGSKEIVSYGSSFGEVSHSCSSVDRPLSSLAH